MAKKQIYTLERLGDYYFDDDKAVKNIVKGEFPNAKIKLIKKTIKQYKFEITTE